jgi:hypothetical protein
LSATGSQVEKQFFAALTRFRHVPAFASWNWLSAEVRTHAGGFLFGRATDPGGNIEGIHDQVGSPASLLIDEAKTWTRMFWTRSRCTTSFRLFHVLHWPGLGRFLPDHDGQVALVENILGAVRDVSARRFRIDRGRPRKPQGFSVRDQHDAKFLYDAGDSMISLEHVRAVIDKPPVIVHGKTSAFCDFAGAGDESVLALLRRQRYADRRRLASSRHDALSRQILELVP